MDDTVEEQSETGEGDKSVGEACTATSECADGLICKDVMTSDGTDTELRCGEIDDSNNTDEEYLAGMGEPCGQMSSGYVDCQSMLVCTYVED